MSTNPTMIETLFRQSNAIYGMWLDGHESTAQAMIAQVPSEKLAFVVFAMTVMAVHENRQYHFSKFIEGITA